MSQLGLPGVENRTIDGVGLDGTSEKELTLTSAEWVTLHHLLRAALACLTHCDDSRSFTRNGLAGRHVTVEQAGVLVSLSHDGYMTVERVKTREHVTVRRLGIVDIGNRARDFARASENAHWDNYIDTHYNQTEE